MHPLRRSHLAVVIAVLALCGQGPEAGSKQAEPVKLRVTTVDSLSNAPLFITLAAGYFEEQGLDIELVTFRRAGAALPSLAQGGLDVFTGMISPSYINLIGRTDDVKIVLARGRLESEGCSSYSFVARRELVESGALEGPEDLEGLRIGTDRTSSSYYVLTRLLAAGGLGPEDVETVDVPYGLKVEAFQRDLLDVSTASEPWTTRMVRTGAAVVWKPAREVVPGFQYGFMLFGPTLLNENREAGRKFITAYLEGVRKYNREGKTPGNLEIIARRMQVDVDFVRDTCWPLHEDDGRLDFAQMDRYQAWALQEKLIDRTLDEEQIWDRAFVDHANRVLGEAE